MPSAMLSPVSQQQPSQSTAFSTNTTTSAAPVNATSSSSSKDDDVAIPRSVVAAVSKSWDQIRKIPNHEKVAGELLFRRLFAVAPDAVQMFGFGGGLFMYPSSSSSTYEHSIPDAMYRHSKAFIKHSTGVVSTLGAAIDLLATDLDLLTATLKQLGGRHAAYDLQPAHFDIFGQALLETLEGALGVEEWTAEMEHAWKAVFAVVSTTMMEGAQEVQQRNRRRQQERKSQTRPSRSSKPNVHGGHSSSSIGSNSSRQSRSRLSGESSAMSSKSQPYHHRSSTRDSIHHESFASAATHDSQNKQFGRRSSMASYHSVSSTSACTYLSTSEEELAFHAAGPEAGALLASSNILQDIHATWSQVKKIPDYENLIGQNLFQNIFDLAPGIEQMFPGAHHTSGQEADHAAIFVDPAFMVHTRNVVRMVDAVTNIIGLDLEPAVELLLDLGKRHAQYDVKPQHVPIVGQAMLKTLEMGLGDAWTPPVQQSWTTLFVFLASTMIKGIQRHEDEQKASTSDDDWAA